MKRTKTKKPKVYFIHNPCHGLIDKSRSNLIRKSNEFICECGDCWKSYKHMKNDDVSILNQIEFYEHALIHQNYESFIISELRMDIQLESDQLYKNKFLNLNWQITQFMKHFDEWGLHNYGPKLGIHRIRSTLHQTTNNDRSKLYHSQKIEKTSPWELKHNYFEDSQIGHFMRYFGFPISQIQFFYNFIENSNQIQQSNQNILMYFFRMDVNPNDWDVYCYVLGYMNLYVEELKTHLALLKTNYNAMETLLLLAKSHELKKEQYKRSIWSKRKDIQMNELFFYSPRTYYYFPSLQPNFQKMENEIQISLDKLTFDLRTNYSDLGSELLLVQIDLTNQSDLECIIDYLSQRIGAYTFNLRKKYYGDSDKVAYYHLAKLAILSEEEYLAEYQKRRNDEILEGKDSDSLRCFNYKIPTCTLSKDEKIFRLKSEISQLKGMKEPGSIISYRKQQIKVLQGDIVLRTTPSSQARIRFEKGKFHHSKLSKSLSPKQKLERWIIELDILQNLTPIQKGNKNFDSMILYRQKMIKKFKKENNRG